MALVHHLRLLVVKLKKTTTMKTELLCAAFYFLFVGIVIYSLIKSDRSQESD